MPKTRINSSRVMGPTSNTYRDPGNDLQIPLSQWKKIMQRDFKAGWESKSKNWETGSCHYKTHSKENR